MANPAGERPDPDRELPATSHCAPVVVDTQIYRLMRSFPENRFEIQTNPTNGKGPPRRVALAVTNRKPADQTE